MKFLIDAQLPPSLKNIFIKNGYDCIHTLDLEKGNETTDVTINKISITEQRVVITKDSDFYKSFVLKKEPFKLIFIKLGNISKDQLLLFFTNHFSEIIAITEKEDIVLIKQS